MADAPKDSPKKLHPTVFDTTAVQISRVYAKALYDAAAKAGETDAVIEEYESLVSDVLDANPTFEATLKSAIIGRGSKAATIRKVFEGQASPLFLNYLLVVNDHGRCDLIRQILDHVKAIHREVQGLVTVEVHSAVELSAEQLAEVAQRVDSMVDGTPELHNVVDPGLIGGLVVRVHDTVYDLSVRTQIRRMKDQMLQRSYHEIQSRRDQFSNPTGD